MSGAKRTWVELAFGMMRRLSRMSSLFIQSALLLMFCLNAPSFAGTLGGEPPDTNGSQSFTVTTPGSHTVTGTLGPTPGDGQDGFSVTIGSGQALTSVSYSGVTTDGYGSALNFYLYGCGLGGTTNFNQTFSNLTGCTLYYSMSGDFMTGAGAWTVTINTIDMPNNKPTDVTLSNYTVSPTAGVDATVGTFSTTDPDSGDTFTYSLVSGAGSANNGSFNISGDTLRANDTSTMAAGSYSILVRTTDQDGAYYEKQMSIYVSNYPSVTINNPGDNLYAYITNVTIGTINNTSTYTGTMNETAYTDFTAKSTDLLRGSNQTISVTIEGNDVTAQTVAAFFDWDQNGSFADADETVTILSAASGGAAGGTTGGPYTANVTVPAGATLGTTRMRVVTDYNRDPLASGNIDYGEAEDYTVNVISPNTAPTFVAATTTLTVGRDAGATDIKGLLHVSDSDSGQTETWSATSGPGHGTLSGFPTTASSGSADITPGGTLTYQPTAGYSGGDSFTVQVSDGTATDTRTITVTVVSPPVVTDPNISISGATGTGGAFKIGDTVTATWNNTAGGDNNSGITGVTVDFSQFGGGAAVAATNSGDTWTATYTIVAGSIDATNRNVSVTATNGPTSTTTADSTSAVVDNIAPTATDARISISGASGTGGAYRIGDTVTANWNNTAGGDNNSDTISGVTVDFSQFGGGAAVAASNSGGIWTATYTIVAGSIDATNRNISVTATDNAGNSTTTADGTNATVDNIAPTVTDARISISGASGTGGAFKIGDTVTATWNNTAGGDNNSDTISSVTVNFSQFGGGSAVAATNSGGTWTATYTIVSGAIDATNRNISVTATDNAGNTTTTSDSTNATVDNIAPTVTDANISISGASGTGGAYKVGDTVTATWNNTAGGDNNSDTISGVTVDFSQFGGGSAVAASNSGGTWTATYTIVSGSISATNRNVSVTATDNAGNSTTTADSTNATVDNIAPFVTSVSVPADGTYVAGQNLDFTVNWSGSVEVDTSGGRPYIPATLNTGGTVHAAYVSGSGTSALLFRYTVAVGNADPDGVTVGSAITLNGGLLEDATGNDALLTLNAVGSTVGVLVDAIAPTVGISAPSVISTVSGPVSYTVTYGDANFNASILASGDVSLNRTGTADAATIGISGSGNTRTVTLSNITGTGTIGISIAAGTASDTAGNTAPAAGPSTTFMVMPTVLYVGEGGLSGGLCDTWANACDLQYALGNAPSGVEIWVKAGTYTPTTGTDRTVNFRLKNGVALYGGFAGTETARSERDFGTNLTVLSGDIGTTGLNTDNSYHVLDASYTDNTAILDGFTISGGNASAGSFGNNSGGAMFIYEGSPTLTNLVFSNNTASNGGALYIDTCSPLLTNVTFNGNSASNGGAIYNYDLGNPVLVNVTMSGNTAGFTGGGILNRFNSNPILTNVTMRSNTAGSMGGGIYNYDGGNPVIKNSIFWGNLAPANPQIGNAFNSFPSISYSVVQGDCPAPSTCSNLIVTDPLLDPAGLQDNGGSMMTISILQGSPAINAGDPSSCPSSDQRGVVRPQGAGCDIGAYEFAAGTTTTVVSSQNPSVFGEAVTFTAGVTGMETGIPAGTITFMDGAASLGSATLDGSGQATFSTSTLSPGSHSITAVYGGDGSFSSSTSSVLTQDVNQGATSVSVGSSQNPSVFGQGVTFTATVAVTAPATGIPTGTVTFFDGATPLGTASLDGSGQATLSTASLTVGLHNVTVVYSGDVNYASSASNALSQTVDRAGAVAVITGAAPEPSVTGQAVTVSYSVTAAAPGSGTPTGNVTVSDGVSGCTGTVAAGSCSLVLTNAGAYTLTATYAGDTNFNGSISAGVAHTVNKAGTTSTITSGMPDPSVAGQTVTVSYSLTVTAPGSGTPTGNVTVSDGGNSCTGTVAAGSCSLVLTNAGAYAFTAIYAGDTNFNGSVSARVAHTVSKAGTTSTIISDTPDPSLVGQVVTVAYTVLPVAPGSGTPAGNVTVSDGVDSCTGTVTGGSCSLVLTTSGARTLTASYAGDANFNGSIGTAPHAVLFRYLLGASVNGSGRVTAGTTGVEGDGIDCGSNCSETYNQGTVVSLAAAPAAGWRLSGWAGDPDCSDGQVTVNGPMTCEAVFVLNNSVTFPAATGNGDITLATNSPNCGFTSWGAMTEAQAGDDAAFEYPYGLVQFALNCADADVTITFPGSVVGSTYRKYGPTTPGVPATSAWYTLGNVTANGNNSVTLHLHDGQLGDDTGVDGIIVDQGGVGQPAGNGLVQVPTLNEWGMIAFMIMSGLGALLYLRRAATRRR